MSTPPYSRQALVRIINEAGWPLVSDRVITGICHDLNGRLNSLTSLGYLLNSGSRDWAGVGPEVEEELKRTEDLSRDLHVLPDDETGPRVLALSELLPQVLRLVRLQPGFETVEWELMIPPDFPAIRMDEALLLRSLSLLLTGMVEGTRGREGARIEILGQTETRTLSIRLGGLGPDNGALLIPDGEEKKVPEDMKLLLAGVFQEMGGELASVRVPGGGWVLKLRLPGLED